MKQAIRNLSVQKKLWVFGAFAISIYLVMAAVGLSSASTVSSGTNVISHAQKMTADVSTAYEQWLLDDDQSNMYAALVVANQKGQAQLAETTWQQAVAGYQGAVAALAQADQVASTATERNDLSQISTNLASYNGFSQKVRADAVAGNTKAALEIMTVGNLAPSNALPIEFAALRSYETTRNTDQLASLRSAVSSMRLLLLVIPLLGLIMMMLGTVSITRLITRPLRRMVEVIGRVAAGDLSETVETESNDEIGQMGTALNAAIVSIRGTLESIDGKVTLLSSSSEQLTEVGEHMSGNAERTASQASSVSAAGEEVSINVNTVAAAVEQMSASITEIANHAGRATEVAARATDMATIASDNIDRLGVNSVEIGNVVSFITSIAEQTNLLALNATIEAARAGESGRGFAVVANEVKELAAETTKATEEISKQIETIQSDTHSAVDSIGQIREIIREISDTMSSIAAAVEEQSATTLEIGRSVSEAAVGVSEIASNVSGVAHLAEDTSSGASQNLDAAAGLTSMASELRELVGQFRY